MENINNLNIIIKIAIFILIWFSAAFSACYDFSNRSCIYWRIKLNRFIKIILFGWLTYFDKYDMSGIVLQIGNYIFFIVYILGDVMGYDKYYNRGELYYPFIIWLVGYILLFVYCIVRGIIRSIRKNRGHDYNAYLKDQLKHQQKYKTYKH